MVMTLGGRAVSKELLLASFNPITAIPIYANLPERLRADPEIALRAVSCDGLALLYTPIRARTLEVRQRAIKNCKFAKAYVLHDLYVDLQQESRRELRLVADQGRIVA
jgi:hypothetical protein